MSLSIHTRNLIGTLLGWRVSKTILGDGGSPLTAGCSGTQQFLATVAKMAQNFLRCISKNYAWQSRQFSSAQIAGPFTSGSWRIAGLERRQLLLRLYALAHWGGSIVPKFVKLKPFAWRYVSPRLATGK
jgi:hypothetical protein